MKSSFAVLTVLCVITTLVGCSPETAKKASSMAESAKSTAAQAKGAMESGAASAKGMLGDAADAAGSMASGEGADMLKNATEAFTSLTSTLTSVTDADSATAAIPQLGKLTESFGGMSDMFGKLPDVAKGSVSGVFGKGLEQIKPLLEKVYAIPGVEAVLKPTIDALMSKLDLFKA
jgi:hypothetical protein